MPVKFRDFIPFLIGLLLSVILGFTVWWVFFFVFSYIGGCITLGQILEKKMGQRDMGRRIAILLISPLFLLFFGLMQRENMQVEETVFYLAYFIGTGIFTRVLIHFCIAKVFGPLIWGRGFCGWACWTAAFLEWLPIKENCAIPKKFTYLRVPALIVSVLVPFLFIQSGYDYYARHILSDSGSLIQTEKFDQLIWFLAGNIIYYSLGILLAFTFKKKRAFCKILCPVSLIMKVPAKIALIRMAPTGNPCIACGNCNRNCPMDIDVMSRIKNGQKIGSTECILCGLCSSHCPVNAIK